MQELVETMDQTVKAMSDREGKYLTFAMTDEEYGIGILKVKEIIGMMSITTVPQAPEFVKGVINLRLISVNYNTRRTTIKIPEM